MIYYSIKHCGKIITEQHETVQDALDAATEILQEKAAEDCEYGYHDIDVDILRADLDADDDLDYYFDTETVEFTVDRPNNEHSTLNKIGTGCW